MQAKPMLSKLSIVCAGALLLAACADLELRAPLALAMGGAASADAAYLEGRQQQLGQRYDAAIKSYRAALAAEAGHVNARNGLASLYAERGDFAQAIPIWRALTEGANQASGPGAAFLFGNLGYAYLLSGEYAQAQAALEKACLLDPLNHRAWQRLGDALLKLGQDERARQMYRQAMTLRQHDFRADYAASGGSAVAAIDTAVKAAPQADPRWGRVDLLVAANGMLELKRSVPAKSAAPQPAPPQPAPAPAAPVAPAPRLVLLEIRNGNGVTGMARALSQQMADPSMKVVRLSNDKGFKVRATRVEYQPAFRAAAERLAERFVNARAVVAEGARASDLRLVIGHDLKGKFALRPLPAAPAAATLAQAAKPGESG